MPLETIEPLEVALLSRHDASVWLRQTESGSGLHKTIRFTTKITPNTRWLAVYDDIAKEITTTIPPQNRIYFVSEPPEFQKLPNAKALSAYGHVVSPFEIERVSGNLINSHSALPWFYGVSFKNDGREISQLNLNQLRNLAFPPKKTKISVVCSTKTDTPMHRARLEVIEKLRNNFPEHVDVFGRGFEQIDDKSDAIAPYKYHLALENSESGHFWTEKLADPLIGMALPLYSGCKAALGYFPEKAIIPIDIYDADSAVKQIISTLDADPYQEHLDALCSARNKLLNDYNLFSMIETIVRQQPPPAEPDTGVSYTLSPVRQKKSRLQKLTRSIKKRVRRYTS